MKMRLNPEKFRDMFEQALRTGMVYQASGSDLGDLICDFKSLIDQAKKNDSELEEFLYEARKLN